MSKEERIYFYSMYCVIMELLQSNNLAVHDATKDALNRENLNIGQCYQIYIKTGKDYGVSM